MVDGGHGAVRVEPAQDGVGDAGQLADLFGGQRVDNVLPDVGDVARRGVPHLVPADRGQPDVGGPGVLRAREAFHQAPVLKPAYHVGEPGQGRVGLRRQGRHPQGPLRRLRQHRERVVLEVRQLGVATQLRVEHPGQQLEHRRQPHPGRHLLVVQPCCVHRHMIPANSCHYNYLLIWS